MAVVCLVHCLLEELKQSIPLNVIVIFSGLIILPIVRVNSGIFGQTAKLGQRPCLFHISNIGIKK